MKLYPIVNRHAAWLVANPIQGCPNNCKYCFLQSVSGTRISPIVIKTPKEAIEEIISSRYYTNDIPLCLFSQTDIFSTTSNIEYLYKFIDELAETIIRNPIILITKCKIPSHAAQKLKTWQSQGRKVIVYISYSGLDKSIEQGIDSEVAKENFRLLNNYGIPIIHYFRPIIPQNGSLEQIEKIVSYVSNYANASVVAGLKVESSYLNNIDFWEDVKNDTESVNAECIWPKESKNYLRQIAIKYNYPIFETNACALSLTLNENERYGFWGTEMCSTFNYCPESRRKKCRQDYCKPEIPTIERNLKNIMGKMGVNYDVQFKLEHNVLYIENVPLSVEDICFISGELHLRVDCILKKQGYYWNTSVNNKSGVII